MEDVYRFAAAFLLDADQQVRVVSDSEHEPNVDAYDLNGPLPYSHDVYIPLRDRAFSWDVALDNTLTPEQLLSTFVSHDPPHFLASDGTTVLGPSRRRSLTRELREEDIAHLNQDTEIFAEEDDFFDEENHHSHPHTATYASRKDIDTASMPPPATSTTTTSSEHFEATLTSRSYRGRVRVTLKTETSTTSNPQHTSRLPNKKKTNEKSNNITGNKTDSDSNLTEEGTTPSTEQHHHGINNTHHYTSASPSTTTSSSSSHHQMKIHPMPTFNFPAESNMNYSNGMLGLGNLTSEKALTSNNSVSNYSSFTSSTAQLSSDRKVGSYTVDERRIKIEKFRERKRQRIWRKQIKYDCRKRLADTRPRVKGRFVSRKNLGNSESPGQKGEGGEDDDESLGSTAIDRTLMNGISSSTAEGMLLYSHSILHNLKSEADIVV